MNEAEKRALEALPRKIGVQEPVEDIWLVGPESAPKPDPRYRQLPLSHFVGRLCKVAFPTKVCSPEHMWVLCTGRARNGKKELGGILHNDPIFVDNLRNGDTKRLNLRGENDVRMYVCGWSA